VDNTNFLEILEIYILKKFTIDEIISLNDFYFKTEDIFQALDYEKEEFLYNLFIIFSKYGNVKICSEIMMSLRKSPNNLEKCHSHLLRISNRQFSNEVLNDANIGLSLIEKIDNSKIVLSTIKQLDFTTLKYRNQDFDVETLDIIGLYDFYDKIKKTRSDLKNLTYSKNYSLHNIVKFFDFYDKNQVENKQVNSIEVCAKELIQNNILDFIDNFNGNSASFALKKIVNSSKKSSVTNEGLLKFLSDLDIKVNPQVFVKNPLYKYKVYKGILRLGKIKVEEILRLEGVASDKLNIDDENIWEILFVSGMIFKNCLNSHFEHIIQLIKTTTFQTPITNIINSTINKILKKTATFTFSQFLFLNSCFSENKLEFTQELLNLFSSEALEFIFSK
jgi:hypothetical protein